MGKSKYQKRCLPKRAFLYTIEKKLTCETKADMLKVPKST